MAYTAFLAIYKLANHSIWFSFLTKRIVVPVRERSFTSADVFLVLIHALCVTDPTKYFGCELGAQTQFDTKNDRYIVNGSHEASKLQDLLDSFIKRFVLCPECDNPETKLVSSDGNLAQTESRCISMSYKT